MDITVRDNHEKKAVGIGARIAGVISAIAVAVPSVCAAAGGLDWLIDNVPLLATGLGSLVTGGVASWIAVRRIGNAAAAQAAVKAAAKASAALCLLASGLMLGGCAGVYTPKLSAFSLGLDSQQILQGLNVTRWKTAETNDYYEIILDASNGQQSSGKLIDGLIAIGEIAARAKGIPVSASTADAPAESPAPAVSAADTEDDSDPEPVIRFPAAEMDYSADGYGASPGAAGEGVYGKPSCARCRAYRAAHPDAQLVNIDVPGNRADMWAALRLRGFTLSAVQLPVRITASGYEQEAK